MVHVKRKKTRVDPGAPSTSTARSNRFGRTTMRMSTVLCFKKRPGEYVAIFLHDKAPSHTSKSVRGTSEKLSSDVLPRASYSADLAPSDYHLFASMDHALAEQRFGSYENVRKWLDKY